MVLYHDTKGEQGEKVFSQYNYIKEDNKYAVLEIWMHHAKLLFREVLHLVQWHLAIVNIECYINNR